MRGELDKVLAADTGSDCSMACGRFKAVCFLVFVAKNCSNWFGFDFTWAGGVKGLWFGFRFGFGVQASNPMT